MRRISILIILLVLIVFTIGCDTSTDIKDIDANKLNVEKIIFENNDVAILSSINDIKKSKDDLFGLEIKSEADEIFLLDKMVALADNNNQYKINFNIRDFPRHLYGSSLFIKPYIKIGEQTIYSSNIYNFKLITEAIKSKSNNIECESIAYVLDYANENYKKVYEHNNAIFIDDSLYEYNSIKLGKEFLIDWNKKFNTKYDSFYNFALENVGTKNAYGTSEEIKNHKLYKFFNDNNQEMLLKYQWVFDVITNMNITLNYIQTQMLILANNKIKDEENNKYSSYYGFYQILAHIEALFTQTQIFNKEYSYSTIDYADVATYYAIQRVFKNNNIFKYATDNYEYQMIGETYQINSEIIEYKGKEWKGFIYQNKTYQVGDFVEIEEKNMYLDPKYEYITYNISFFDGDTNLKQYSKIYNVGSRDISLPVIDKYGFNFIGWYTSKTFDNSTKVEVIKTGTIGDFVLYAKFEPKSYSEVEVNFNLNGGVWSYNYENTQVFQNPIELPIPQRDGCKFNGWVSDYDDQVYTSYPGYYDFTKKINYTATWEVINMNDLERIEGTYEELLKYFDENKLVTTNLDLPVNNDFYKTKISYISDKQEFLSNEGILNRPYIQTNVTFTITISSNDTNKQYSYELTVDGFKELKNIASSYVYSSYDKLTDEFFETMDIIFCAFVLIDVDGGFEGLDGVGNSVSRTNKTYLSYMKQYVLPKAHANGVRVVASIGGGGNSVDLAYEQIVKSEEKMNNLANNIVALINEYGFDGADLDWEIPDNAKTFSRLSEKVYKAVKANNPNHIVTAAIGAGMWQPPKYDLTVSKNYLDYINLMSYNMVGNGGYHHSALYKSNSYFDSTNKVGHTLNTCSIEETMAIYKNNYGVEANQMIIGAAFYGMMQKRTVNNGVYGSWQASGTLSYTKIRREYLTSSNYEYFYDTKAEVPYILSKDRTIFISYDDPRSIIAKCDYVKKTGAAGIMYWQNGQDTTGELVKAIKDGFNK